MVCFDLSFSGYFADDMLKTFFLQSFYSQSRGHAWTLEQLYIQVSHFLW